MSTVSNRPLILEVDSNGRLIQKQSTEVSLQQINAIENSNFNLASGLSAGRKVFIGSSDAWVSKAGDSNFNSVTAKNGVDATSATLSGALTADSATLTQYLQAYGAVLSGPVQANSANFAVSMETGSATVNGALSANSASITNGVSASSATISGNLTAANAILSSDLYAVNASLTGALSAASASITNGVNAASATLSGALSAASASLTGDLSAANATLSGTATAAALTVSGLAAGIAHVDASGVFSSSEIVNADVAANAAIAGTKISPDFGAYNVITTGTLTAASASLASGAVYAGMVMPGVAGVNVGGSGNTGNINVMDLAGNPLATVTANFGGTIGAANIKNSVSPGPSSFSVDSDGYVIAARAKLGAVEIAAASGGNSLVSNVANPQSDNDAANKYYVDSVAQGLNIKAACAAATTANITLEGTQTIDTVAVAVGDRVLVKNQTNNTENGIYVVAEGAWVRSQDMNDNAEFAGAFTFVQMGDVNADTGWVCTTNPPVVIGETAIVFTQFSGAGAYIAGNNILIDGNVINVTDTVTLAGDLNAANATLSGALSAASATLGATNVSGGLTVDTVDAADVNATTANLLSSVNVGDVSAATVTIDGSAGSISAVSATLSGALSAGMSTLGATSVSGGLSADSATISGALSAGSTTLGATSVSGGFTADSLVVSSLGLGIAHVDGSGNFSSSALVDSDVDANAAIAGTKIAPDFGSNAVTTTGSLSADSATFTNGVSAASASLTGALSAASATLSGDLSAASASIGAVSITNAGLISNVAAPQGDNDAATKKYVDDAVASADFPMTAGEALAAGDPLVFDPATGNALKALAAGGVSYQYCIGVAQAAAASGATVNVLRNGVAAGVLSGATAGKAYYVAAGGGLVDGDTGPGTGAQWVLVGYAMNGTDLLVQMQDYGFVAA